MSAGSEARGGSAIPPAGELLTLVEVADRCGLHPELVRRFVALGLVEPAGAPDAFAPAVTIRVERIVRLHADLGVNYAGIGVILDLLERIESLEALLAARAEGS